MTDQAIKTKVLRISTYLTKKDGCTQDQFNQYWSHIHGPLVKGIIEKHGFLQYTQVRANTPYTLYFYDFGLSQMQSSPAHGYLARL